MKRRKDKASGEAWSDRWKLAWHMSPRALRGGKKRTHKRERREGKVQP